MRNHCLPALILPALILMLFAAPAWSSGHCPRDMHELMAHLDMTGQYERITFEVSHTGEADAFSRRERYEPWHAPEQRWILLEQDGEIPGTKDRKRFASRRATQGNPLLYYLNGIQDEGFELVEQSASRQQYHYQPGKVEVGSGGKNALDVSEHVRGTATLLDDDEIGCVLTINLTSPEAFSPRTGVGVKVFSLTSRFVLDESSGLFFPESSYLILKGRAFLVAGFDVLNRATYSAVNLLPPDYAGPAQASAGLPEMHCDAGSNDDGSATTADC